MLVSLGLESPLFKRADGGVLGQRKEHGVDQKYQKTNQFYFWNEENVRDVGGDISGSVSRELNTRDYGKAGLVKLKYVDSYCYPDLGKDEASDRENFDPFEILNAQIADSIGPLKFDILYPEGLENSCSAGHEKRKFVCKICEKRFKRPSSLSTHMNIHTGRKPFACPSPNCGKSFNAKSNMLRHFKLHFKLSSGVFLLPNGEVTHTKPSSKDLHLYLERYSPI